MQLSDIPVTIQIILLIITALGLRELIAAIGGHFLAKKKTDAEVAAIKLANSGKYLVELQEGVLLMESLAKKYDSQLEIISALKEEKLDDNRKIYRRDGVIEEQRLEIKQLHIEVAALQVKEKEAQRQIQELEKRMANIELQNSEILKENLQLKAMQQTK